MRLITTIRKFWILEEREVPFDCLVTIPLHSGDPAISKSGLGDEFGFVKANKNTLQSLVHKNIFVIGDAGNFPASKAGSVAHFQADVLAENIAALLQIEPLQASFDGHSNCYIETGYGKGILIDFNYDTEPLPGYLSLPGIGSFLHFLKKRRINHYRVNFFSMDILEYSSEGKKIAGNRSYVNDR